MGEIRGREKRLKGLAVEQEAGGGAQAGSHRERVPGYSQRQFASDLVCHGPEGGEAGDVECHKYREGKQLRRDWVSACGT